MSNTKIEWTDKSWNPITGCTPYSEGCNNCYALKMCKRLKGMNIDKYIEGTKIKCHPECLNEPYKWKVPSKIFICSMSDVFHDQVPLAFIINILYIIQDNPQHIFQILTKRADNMFKFFTSYSKIPKNLWIGVTVESNKYVERINYLKKLTDLDINNIKFVSFEPLLSEINLTNNILDSTDWVIVGGESGSNCRPLNPQWVRNILKECKVLGIPFFFKQWGGRNKHLNGNKLDGVIYNEFPKY
jgi:protein gp37